MPFDHTWHAMPKRPSVLETLRQQAMSIQLSKEEVARRIARNDHVTIGLVILHSRHNRVAALETCARWIGRRLPILRMELKAALEREGHAASNPDVDFAFKVYLDECNRIVEEVLRYCGGGQVKE